MLTEYRNKTKMICTMGPASNDDETIKEMIAKGMNIARYNFSHGTHEEQLEKVNRMKKIREELGVNVGLLQDTKGPEIRLGLFENGKAELKDGAAFTLTTEEVTGNDSIASITYKGLVNDVTPGTVVLVNDGLLELVVKEITDKEVRCEVVHGGIVSNRKAINVPSVHLNMPFLSEVDKEDLKFGASVQYDYVALSFVRCARDVLEAKAFMEKYDYHPFIISKIENQEGIEHLEEILDVSDGIMVARGDMGVEIDFAMVPQVQHKMIDLCLAKGKVVIVATNMLESMCNNPRPTRAEVNDVASANYQGATCTMLSGESAAGKYPVNAVDTMAKINAQAELFEMESGTSDISFREALVNNACINHDLSYNVVSSAIDLAEKIRAKALVCLSLSGCTIKKVSSFRPMIPIIGCTTNERSYRQTSILYGVSGMLTEKKENEEELLNDVLHKCIENELLHPNDTVVVIAGVPFGVPGKTNMIKVVTL